MATDWERFTGTVAERFVAAGKAEGQAVAEAELIVGEVRYRLGGRDEDDRPLTPAEASALLEDPGLVAAAGLAMDHWSARRSPRGIQTFLRSELTYGPAATLKHSPFAMALTDFLDEPIGPEGAARLEALAQVIKERAAREGITCDPAPNEEEPRLYYYRPLDTIIRSVTYASLVGLCWTGATDEAIADALLTCSFDIRKTTAVIRDGVPPALSDGAL